MEIQDDKRIGFKGLLATKLLLELKQLDKAVILLLSGRGKVIKNFRLSWKSTETTSPLKIGRIKLLNQTKNQNN